MGTLASQRKIGVCVQALTRTQPKAMLGWVQEGVAPSCCGYLGVSYPEKFWDFICKILQSSAFVAGKWNSSVALCVLKYFDNGNNHSCAFWQLFNNGNGVPTCSPSKWPRTRLRSHQWSIGGPLDLPYTGCLFQYVVSSNWHCCATTLGKLFPSVTKQYTLVSVRPRGSDALRLGR